METDKRHTNVCMVIELAYPTKANSVDRYCVCLIETQLASMKEAGTFLLNTDIPEIILGLPAPTGWVLIRLIKSLVETPIHRGLT